MAMSPEQIAAGIHKLEPRMLAALSEFDVSEQTCAQLGEVGCTLIPLFTGPADTVVEFRTAIVTLIGLDPKAGAKACLEMARVVSAYGAAKTRHEVTVKATAERQAQFQPTRVNMEDVDEC